MSDPLSGITNIRPAYPVRPLQPSQDDRQSGQRRKPLPENRPEDQAENKPGDIEEKNSQNNSVVNNDGTEEDRQSIIDEYI